MTSNDLILSTPTGEDVDAIYAACQDRELQRWTSLPTPYEREHAEEFVARVETGWMTGNSGTWAIRQRDVLVGMLTLNGLKPGRAGEVSCWIVSQVRGRGVATTATKAVVDWGFASEGGALHRIEWRAVVGNWPSAYVARSVGFRFEGLLRGALFGGAEIADAWIAGLLVHDDRAPRPWPILDARTGTN